MTGLRRVTGLSLLLLVFSGALYPCGGPDAYPVAAPLLPERAYLENLLQADYETGQRRAEVRFLYPERLTRPDALEILWQLSYGSDSGYVPIPDSLFLVTVPGGQRLEDALQRGDLAAAGREAQALVGQVLDMPAAQADSNQPAFRRAVEFLEWRDTLARVAPERIGATLGRLRAEVESLPRSRMGAFAEAHPRHPRAASLRFVAIQEAMKAGIPDGWLEEIQQQMSPEAWQRLEDLHDQWLRDYPDHPLADLVRMSRLRLYYLRGDARRCWELLTAMYPRHRARVLAEMRHLLVNGVSEGVDSLTFRGDLDPALRTALLGELPAGRVSAGEWTALWHLSAGHRGEPWALSLQERLLQKAAEAPDSGALPPGFPVQAANPRDGLGHPTPWGYFRALALAHAGKRREALEQAALPGMADEVAPLRVKLRLERREWTRALSDSGLDYHARQYLVWVLAPDSVLASLGRRGTPIGREARLASAVHTVRGHGWAAGAAALDSLAPETAALWRRAGILQGDSSLSGRLAWARFLRDHADRLYFPLSQTHTWYRSLEYRRASLLQHLGDISDLPWTPTDEVAAIERHHLETSARYDALGAYAGYLDRAPAAAPAFRDALREADAMYNLMLNWDQIHGFWRHYLEHAPEGQIIRRAGRRARSG